MHGNMMFIICLLVSVAQFAVGLALIPESVSLPSCPVSVLNEYCVPTLTIAQERCLKEALQTSNCSKAGVTCVCNDDGLFDGFVTCSHHECKPKDILGELKSCIHPV